MSYNKETRMYEGYIYYIDNNIDSNKYVGQTITTIKNRWRQHKSASENNTNYHLYNAMKVYGVENFFIHEIKKVQHSSKKELLKILDVLEKQYVAKFDSYNNGYNLTPGGRDSMEHQYRPVKKYDLDGNYIDGYDSIESLKKILNKECVSSIYACCYGEIRYAYGYVWRFIEDEINKYPLPTEDEKCEAITRIKSDGLIKQYSLIGELINIHNNATDASKSTGVKRVQIVNSCSGKKISGGGFVWRFDGDEFNSIKSTNDKSKTVYQYDKNLNLIRVFCSTRQASKETGVNRNSIGEVCRGRQRTAGGFLWSYTSYSKDNTKLLEEAV